MKPLAAQTKQTYEMVYVCDNCKYKIRKQIPFGQEAPQIGGFPDEFPDEVCPYCGCTHFSNPFRPDDKRVK